MFFLFPLNSALNNALNPIKLESDIVTNCLLYGKGKEIRIYINKLSVAVTNGTKYPICKIPTEYLPTVANCPHVMPISQNGALGYFAIDPVDGYLYLTALADAPASSYIYNEFSWFID